MSFRGLLIATGLMLVTLAPVSFGVAAARAEIGLVPDSFSSDSFQQNGSSATQAAEHPYSASSEFEITRSADEAHLSGRLRDVEVELPPGFVGNPQVVEACSRSDFAALVGSNGLCPASSQVGIATIQAWLFGGPTNPADAAVYNLDPIPGAVAQFGFIVGQVPTVLTVSLNAARHYRLRVRATKISEGLTFLKSKVVFWGVPNDPSHDAQRACGNTAAFNSCSIFGAQRPFLTNPSACGPSPTATLAVDSWEAPDVWQRATYTPADVDGCSRLSFEPTFNLAIDTDRPDSPTGVDVALHFPYNESPDGLGSPPLRDARVDLPHDLTINPGSADGLRACSDAQIGFQAESPVVCPEASKIGTVEAVTPVLPDPIQGSMYLLTQNSNDPESGEMLRLALVLDDAERGLLIKLPGSVFANRDTGQLTTSFPQNPQLPVSDISLKLKAGPRAPLKTGSACGTYGTHIGLTSWARPNELVSIDSSFPVDQNCGNESKFTPGFAAGTTNPIAGRYSPFTLRVIRADGEQNISRIQSTLPEGLLAKLAGIPPCGDAQAATGNCPAASQVGTTTVGAGAGSSPLYVPQPGKAPTAVYLAGPYRGAPLSLVVKVPAQAGPFDLGVVTVRNALNVDPVNARASVSSDPLPQILQGIPIAYRDIRVDVNRPDFTVNPTSCDPMKVDGVLTSAQGKAANVSSRFQVANCERLAFKPKLAIELSGKTSRSSYPKLKATLTMPKGNANIARARVTLPKTEILAQEHIKTICTRVQYAAKACPKASIYGYAKAWSPLLDKPLQGPVYLRSSSNPLPDLVASLDGQIHIDLQGRIDSKNARIRNTFDLVPDAPVSKFVLTMQGGKKSLLVNNTNLCEAKPRASVEFDAHNGKVADSNPLAKVGCGRQGRAKK